MNTVVPTQRRYFIDNLRSTLVYLLIPYHTFMMYNNWGEGFYVFSRPLALPSLVITMIWPWFMPTLFVLAGASAAFSLERRSMSRYVKERFIRLFVPLVLGIILIIPIQTYYAERFHNGYTGTYLEQYLLFFGKVGDLTGFNGGFTPGQLWFILYLFIISMASIPLILLLRRRSIRMKLPLEMLLLFLAGFAALYLRPLLNIGGKSLMEYFWYFMLGYLFLSKDHILDTLERWRHLLGAMAVVIGILLAILLIRKIPIVPHGELFQLYAWSAILFLIGLFKRYMNRSGPFARYLAASSFSVYVLHQSILVFVAFYIFKPGIAPLWEMLLVILSTTILTVSCFELWRRMKRIRQTTSLSSV